MEGNYTSPVRVAVVSTDFPATYSENLLSLGYKAKTVHALLAEAAKAKPDIIVFPEDSNVIFYLGTSTAAKILEEGGKDILLVDSSPTSVSSKNKEKMIFYRPGEDKQTTEEKHFLVPYGEYLPYHAILLARIFRKSEWLSDFNGTREYAKGDIPKPYYFGREVLGALFCSEIIPENFYRKLAQGGAGLFVNASSQAIFGGNTVLRNQTLSMAKMKAVANRRYFIQSGNMAATLVLNDSGEIIAAADEGKGVFVAPVYFNYAKTPYTRFGDWVVPASVLLLILVAYFRRGR